MKSRKKLTLLERQQIYRLQELGFGVREISRNLGRAPSTISRELRRNRPPGSRWDSWSKAKFAHDKALSRRRKPRFRLRLKNFRIRGYVEQKLVLGWTPELISGRIELELTGESISHEAIYQYLYKEERSLIQCLPIAGRRGRAPRARRKRRRELKLMVPKRPISKRPKVVQKRKRFGDWEADTIVSKKSTYAIHTLQERKSRKVFLSKLSSCSTQEAYNATLTHLSGVPEKLKYTLTQDNGSENFFHDRETRLGLDIYFCNPYSAWERGSVERANQLIRRFVPKKTDLKMVSRDRLQFIEDSINNRPMKCLGFKTPNEVYAEQVAA